MSEIENEKVILEQTPDFDKQRLILEEEKNERDRLKKFYIHISGIFFCMLLIILIAHMTIDIYITYTKFSTNTCENVNIDVKDEEFKIINVASNGSCIPEYNIDYYNNRRVMFNMDLYGDKTFIFNKINQMDASGAYCNLNCDKDNDGWPDYNIDLNGDGTADINIVKDPQNSTICDLNCDLNYDTIADTNIDLDGDGTPDINITNGDYTKPYYNIDYKGNRKPTFNILENGVLTNPVNDATKDASCQQNCDADGDGWPDYNITLPGSDVILNEVIETTNIPINYDKGKTVDWKCALSANVTACTTGKTILQNKYINIDVNGDGIPDVNISSDHGVNITNPLNYETEINGKKVILNEDKDKDGFPDYNIDLNGDGILDLNITNNDYICTRNCDTNNDGKPDYKVAINRNQNELISIKNINLDIDFDAKCDVNCDTNYDLIPDYNIDLDGDKVPDLNIDYDGDGIADFNIDLNGDGIPDKNLSAYGDGVCNFNCDGSTNIVDASNVCTKNCDTDNDGWPDINVDLDGDGICDINCDNNTTKLDTNGDYFLDSDDKTKDFVIDTSDKSTFYILNPIDIKASDIEPSWNDTYVLKIVNNTQQAMAYKIYWDDVLNEFTDENNLDYFINRNGAQYVGISKAPREYNMIKDHIIIRANTTIKYIMKMSWAESGYNQNIDSGKRYTSKLKVETIK